MGPPSWLYYLFALAMLSVAAYSLSLFVLSLRLRDPAGRDVDIAHLSMGMAMAGMFVPHWAFWPSWFWIAVFFILMVWFVARSAQSIQRFGLHVPHETVHGVMSFSMLLMYWFPATAASGSMSMSMSSAHGILDPGVGLLLALSLLGSAVFTLASPNKGASHHGTHAAVRARVYAMAGNGASGNGTEPVDNVQPAPPGLAAALVSPRLEDLSHVVMCVGMAFMLVLML